MEFEVGDTIKYNDETYIISEVMFIEYNRGEEVWTYKGTNVLDHSDVEWIDHDYAELITERLK